MHFASGSNEPGEGGRGAQQDFGVSASVQLLLVASDHHVQVQAFSGPTTDDVPVRASQWYKLSVSSLVHFASGSNEPGEGGRSKISGSVRQCNFHWWPRRFAVQVKNSEPERAYD